MSQSEHSRCFGKMEKSTSTAAQTTEPPPPPPPPPSQDLPLPKAADHRSSPAMGLDGSPGQPHPSAQGPTLPSSRGRKRLLEGNLQIENSNYYQMRLLLKDLRPHFLEVLRTPDLRNCKSATEIQEKMKLMLQLYQEMMGETPKRTKSESLSNGNQTPTGISSDGVVGGSAFGWNFVTYGGTEAVYCGMSKQEYRSSHPIIQPEVEVELQKPL